MSAFSYLFGTICSNIKYLVKESKTPEGGVLIPLLIASYVSVLILVVTLTFTEEITDSSVTYASLALCTSLACLVASMRSLCKKNNVAFTFRFMLLSTAALLVSANAVAFGFTASLLLLLASSDTLEIALPRVVVYLAISLFCFWLAPKMRAWMTA